MGKEMSRQHTRIGGVLGWVCYSLLLLFFFPFLFSNVGRCGERYPSMFDTNTTSIKVP